MSRSASRMLLRCTSVGWAVSTGDTWPAASVCEMVLVRDAGPAQARQRHLDAAFLRVAGALVDGAAADVVAVFGQVGQVAEVGEGADHAHRLLARQRLEQLLERLVGLVVGIAAEGHRELADVLDQLEGVHAFLLADDVAQDAAQQADVLDQRAFVVAWPAARAMEAAAWRGCGAWVLLNFSAARMLASDTSQALQTGYEIEQASDRHPRKPPGPVAGRTREGAAASSAGIRCRCWA